MFQVELELDLSDHDKDLADFFRCLVFHEIAFKIVAKDTLNGPTDQSEVFITPVSTARFTCRDKVGLITMIILGWGSDQSMFDLIKEENPIV